MEKQDGELTPMHKKSVDPIHAATRAKVMVADSLEALDTYKGHA